jgi:PAS domain S-box-containing protein
MKKILVIDDDNTLRQMTANTLRKRGYDVLEATDGQKGLELAIYQLPDLVLSDIMMTGVDGFDVLQGLRSQPATSAIPVVLMTGEPKERHMRSGMEGGADDFLAKPFSAKTLCNAVSARLERQDAIQQQAKEQEALMLEILSATQDLVAIADAREGRLLYVNAAGRRLLGFGPVEDLKNFSLQDFQIRVETDGTVDGKMAGAGAQSLWTGESILASREGRRIAVNQQILAHHSPAGQLAYLSVVASDLTERQRMNQALHHSEVRYQELVTSLGEGIVFADAELRFTFANPAAESLFGVWPGQLIGKRMADFVTEQDRTALQKQIQLRQARQKSSYEIEIIAANGEPRRLLVTGTPRAGSDGGFGGTFAVLHDITRRKQMERALRESQRLQRAILDNIPDPAWLKDQQGRYLIGNKSLAEIYQRRLEDIVGKTFFEVFPKRTSGLFQGDKNVAASGKPVRSEHCLPDRTGQSRWFDTIEMPILDEDGQIAGTVGIARDVTERKQMELELRQQTALFEALVNSSPDGILVVNEHNQKIFQNPRLNELLKIPRHLAEQSEDAEQLQYVANTTKSPEIFREQVLHLYAHPEKISRDEIEFKDGRVLDRYTSPVFGKRGENYGRIWNFRDITERKRAEEQSRLQTSALEASANGIVITNHTGHILWVNHAFAQLTGYSAAEAVGKTLALLKSGKHTPEFYQNLWNTILGGNVWHGEIINRRKDGAEYFEEMTITPVRDEKEGIQNFIAIKRDISQRKRDEEALRAREESFRALADNVPDAVARIDRDLRFVYGNRALANDVGYEPAVFHGKSGAELKLPLDDQWRKRLTRVFQTGTADIFEFQWKTPGGTRFREARLVPELSATGEVEFVLTITRDFTEQKMAEQNRQMMEVQLRQAQKLEAIGQLAAGIAHEINTPTQYVGDNTRFLKDAFEDIIRLLGSHRDLLAAAKQNALTPEMLENAGEKLAASDLDYLSTQIPQAIQETLEGVERVTKIVRAMKEFSHPGGREKTPADLNKAIESTATVARNEWKYVSDLKLDLDAQLPLVPCFLGEFNQTILNLIINAAHAIGDVVKQQPGAKGTITIQTRRDDGFVAVRVSDTGTGISEATRPHIFEPFFTTKDVGRGTGQGLTMVYSTIVKKHGGTVNFETEVGKGTTFIIRLPINPPNPAVEKSSLPETATSLSGA